MTRPRLLLVPAITQMEWPIRSQLEEWAEVASFDWPGVAGEPPPDEYNDAAGVERGLSALEELRWDRFVVATDEFAASAAVQIAAAVPERVAGLAFGHACLNFGTEGEAPAIRGGTFEAFKQMARTDYRAFAHALSELTQQAYDEEFVERYVRDVPREITVAYNDGISDVDLGSFLARLDVPLLLAEHRPCLLWTEEGFREAVKAFPDAMTMSTPVKPSASPEFAAALKDFCMGLPG